MTLNEIKKYAETKIEELLPGEGYTFKFDNAKKRFGQCSYTRKTISLSKPLTEINIDDNFWQIKDTILHEIAHALSYVRYGRIGIGHNSYWQRTCIEIGANPKRTYSAKDVNTVKGKFVYVCRTCGRESFFHKRLKTERACGKCCRDYNNGKFSFEHLMKLTPKTIKA